jgi:formiminotetrahydrofolate cyclodeaminase
MDSFLKQLAQARPNPGGGAAAAYGAGLALALLEKVVRLEAQRPPNPAGEPPVVWRKALARLQRLTENLSRLREEDVSAYFNLSAARASGDAAVLAAALREAVACPRRIMQQVSAALELLAWAGARCRPHLVSDLLVAGEFLGAALRGAAHIARANLPLMPDEAGRQALAEELRRFTQEGDDLHRQVEAALLGRMI